MFHDFEMEAGGRLMETSPKHWKCLKLNQHPILQSVFFFREKFIKKQRKNLTNVSFAHTPTLPHIFLFFPPYMLREKQWKKGKKKKKLTFQHFWLSPTYLKLTFVIFLLFFFTA